MEISDMALILSELPEETLQVMWDAVHEFLNTRPDVEKAILGIALKSAIVEAERRHLETTHGVKVNAPGEWTRQVTFKAQPAFK